MRSDPSPRLRSAPGLWLSLLGVCVVSVSLQSAAPWPPSLHHWLQTQTNLQTWSAQVVQTRTLQTLTHSLQSTGRVWFSAPNRFRWEIGQPPRTIALRRPADLLVVYPRLKRVERYSLGADAAPPWKETLALLEAGFPRSQAELEKRFAVVSQSLTNGVLTLGLQPRSLAARRMMPVIKILLATNNWTLQATEMSFTDGSIMRNDFFNPQLNPPLDNTLFQFEPPPDYSVVEPLRK